MTNLIKFPGRHRPQNSEPPYNELMALELELVRARLAQVRSETRQANIFWFWYCLKRVVLWGFLFWLLATFASAAQAQSTTTRSFYGSNGSFVGSSTTRGNSSSVYDNQGSFAGSSMRHGNSTTFFDEQGRYTGSSINTGLRRW
jgi:hypothetical protein